MSDDLFKRIAADRFLPDYGISKKDASFLLAQFMAGEISEDDFWYSLGFDFDERGPNMKEA